MIREVAERDVSTVLETVRSWPERARRELVDGVLATLTVPTVRYVELSTEADIAREDLAGADHLTAELAGFRNLDEDWDGAGASPPSAAAIQSAENWLRAMCRSSADATLPDSVAPGVDGDVVFYWQRRGLLIEATITRSSAVEWMEMMGDRTRHLRTQLNMGVSIAV